MSLIVKTLKPKIKTSKPSDSKGLFSPPQSKQALEVVQIDKMYHPFIRGPSSETEKRLLSDFRPGACRINIPPLSVAKNEISVAGEKEAVVAVVAAIKKMHVDMVG